MLKKSTVSRLLQIILATLILAGAQTHLLELKEVFNCTTVITVLPKSGGTVHGAAKRMTFKSRSETIVTGSSSERGTEIPVPLELLTWKLERRVKCLFTLREHEVY